ncbi:hypothetical protein N8587_01420 [Akkermansiaceae bacterium]|nr:hypothetical protein [Akkermansiaceae bacterium]
MPFINNQKENFKKSDSAWGDDNITYYNTPNAKPMQRMGDMNIQNMSYQDLEDMITQISSVQPSNAQDKFLLNQKLMFLQEEKSKRDALEDITRDERDDAFEPQDTTIKEDVIETTNEPIELGIPVDDMLINDGYIEPENKTNDFVIAGLIIILAITLID